MSGWPPSQTYLIVGILLLLLMAVILPWLVRILIVWVLS